MSEGVKRMTRFVAANGKEFTVEDIARWAAEAESEEDYAGTHPGPSRPGRPASVGEQEIRDLNDQL